MFDNIYSLILLIVIVGYAIISGQVDQPESSLFWLIISSIEIFAIILSWISSIRRLLCRITGGITQLYVLNTGLIPLLEAFVGIVLVIVEIILLFKGINILHRCIFFLYGILIVWTRYKSFVDESVSYPFENKTDIPPDAGTNTVAVVVKCGTKGGVIDSDMILHYWKYEYDYKVPGKDKIKKHRDVIEFLASAWGDWFEKYKVGFRFPIRYNKYCPKQHIRLHSFD